MSGSDRRVRRLARRREENKRLRFLLATCLEKQARAEVLAAAVVRKSDQEDTSAAEAQKMRLEAIGLRGASFAYREIGNRVKELMR